MSAATATSLMVLGAFFMLVAALGVFRMPDVYTRISAASKGATLGLWFLLAGTTLHFGDARTLFRDATIVLFIGLTVPIAGHLLGRASYRSGAPLWSGSLCDDLQRAAGDSAPLADEPAEPPPGL